MRKIFIFAFLIGLPTWVYLSKGFSKSTIENTDEPVSQTLVMLDTIPISLNKNAMSPPEGDTIKPPDTVKYAISLMNLSTNITDTIDSVTVHDYLDPLVYDTAWIDSIPSGDSASVSGLSLTWTIYNLPRLEGHVIYFNGRMKNFICEDVIPDSVVDTAYSDLSFFDGHVVLPAVSNPVVHYIVNIPAELGLSKEPEAAHPNYDTLSPGETITYYIECRNDSAFPLKDVVIKDFLDDDVLEIVYCNHPLDTVPCTNCVEWHDSCLLAYSSYYCTLTVRVGYEFKAEYTRFDTLYNWAIAYGDTDWVSDTTWSDTTTHYIYRKLDVHLDKSADPPSGTWVSRGDSISYRVWFYNDITANSVMRDVQIRDTLDNLIDTAINITTNNGTLDYIHPVITWTIDSLAPGDSFVGTYLGVVSTSAPFGDTVFNWYKSYYPYPEDTIDLHSDTTEHYIGKAELDFNKIANPVSGSTVDPGDTITYYLDITNNGDVPARDVVINDTLDDDVLEIVYCNHPADTVLWSDGIEWHTTLIPVGSTYYCTLQVVVGYEFKAVYERTDTIYNWAWATGDTLYTPDTGWSDTTIHYIHRKLDVFLDKSADPVSGTWVSRGDSILYTLTFYNDTSANSVMRDVEIRDTLDDPLIDRADHITPTATYTHPEIFWTIDSLAPGDSFVGEYYGFVDSSAPFGDTVFNWYRVHYDYPEHTIDTTSGDTTEHYIGKAELDFNKTADPVSGSTVLPGDIITYYLDITNNGDVPARDVEITDTLDDDVTVIYYSDPAVVTETPFLVTWQIDSLDVDSTYYCTLQVTVGYEFKAVYERTDTIYNWAWATGDTLYTPDISWSDTTIHYIHRKLDVFLDKTAVPVSGSVIEPGDTINYLLTFYNDTSANSVMRDITITDNLDAWIDEAIQIGGSHPSNYLHPVITWTIDSFAPGDSFAGWYRGVVNTLAPAGDFVLNWFIIDYPDVIDSTSDTTVHYIGTERIDKSAEPPTGTWVAPGNTIHYTLWYYNTSHDTVLSVELVDTVDLVHLDILSVSTGGTLTGNVLTWDIGDIAPWDSGGVWFDAQVKTGAPAGDTIPNIGVFNGTHTGSSSTEHYIMAIPEIRKESEPVSGSIVNPADTIDYRLILNNGSDTPCINILISDTITNVDTAWTTGIAIGSDSWSHVGRTWTVEWDIDSIPADTTDTLFYSAIVGDVVGDSVENFATIRDSLSNKTIHYIEIPDIRLDKDAYLPFPDSSVVEPGDTIKYWIAYHNAGGDTAHNAEILDLIDTNFIETCINITPIPSLYTQDTILWTLGDLAPGDSGITEYWGIVRTDVSNGSIVNPCKSFDIDTVTDTTFHFLVAEKTSKWANPPTGTVVRPRAPIWFYLSYVSGAEDTIVTIIDTLDTLLDTPNIITNGGVWDGTCITWNLTVLPHSVNTVSFQANVLVSAVPCDTIYNYAIFETSLDSCIEGPTVHPIGLPHIQIFKSAIPTSGSYVTSGDIIQYTLTCDNTLGTDTAFDIRVHDTLSSYFTLPDIIVWNVGDVPPGVTIDTTFDRTIIPNPVWGDTVFNIPVLFSPTDPDVDTTTDTTYHILANTSVDIIKQSYKLNGWEVLPELSCVYPDSSFYYNINITNVGSVAGKKLIITDTIRNSYNCIEIDNILSSPDSVWWHGNNASIPPNVISCYVPVLDTAETIHIRFRAHIRSEISFKNEVWDTLETLNNTCWVEAPNIELDSSNTHQLNVCYTCGVQIEPDTTLSVFVSESRECILRVVNTGSFTDSISIVAFNTNPLWSIFPQDTVLPNIPPDSIFLLPVILTAPDEVSIDTAYVIATSARSVRIGKTVKDTAIIIITSGKRIVNILVEPDDSSKTSGATVNYDMRVINNGNDYDAINISMIELSNGWQHELTHTNGNILQDTDFDGKIDVGAVPPYGGIIPLLLKVIPPSDIASGINICHRDTLIIWGTSSHTNPLDSVIIEQDSACVITELKITKPEIHNYPNPFNKNKGTAFIFVIPQRAKCTLIVYTRKGELIDVIFEGREFELGRHKWDWDARNRKGHKIGAGAYLYTFKAGNRPLIVKKLVVLPPRD